MNPTSNFHPPLPGDSAVYYCINCKLSFSAKVPQDSVFEIFKKITNKGTVKCPNCKKTCILDPKIQY